MGLVPAPNSPKRKPHLHSCHPQFWKLPASLSVWSGLLCTRGLLWLVLAQSVFRLQPFYTFNLFNASIILIRWSTAPCWRAPRLCALFGSSDWCCWVYSMSLYFSWPYTFACSILIMVSAFLALPSFTVHPRAPLSAACLLWPQKRQQSAGSDSWASPLHILILWPTSTILYWTCLLNMPVS